MAEAARATPVTIVVAAATGLGYGRGVLRGVTRYARIRRDCRLMPMPIDSLPELARWSPDFGFVVQASDPRLARQLAELRAAVVNVADNDDELVLPTVMSDHHAVGALAAGHFLDRGFHRLAYYGPADWYSRLRYEGFRNSIAAAQPGATIPWLSADQDVADWLASQRLALAVLAGHDAAAQHVVGLCRSLHLNVPEQVAVVGVDNDELLCEAGDVPLSSVAVDAVRIGFEAARWVDARLADRALRVPQRHLVAPLGVVTRRSSEVTAIEDPVVSEAVAWLQAHLQQPLTVEDLLERFPVSRRHLEKRFRAALGRSPAQELRRLRVERVKQLIDTTDLPLARIATEVGWASLSVLCQVFSRVVGMTASQYRTRGRLPA